MVLAVLSWSSLEYSAAGLSLDCARPSNAFPPICPRNFHRGLGARQFFQPTLLRTRNRSTLSRAHAMHAPSQILAVAGEPPGARTRSRRTHDLLRNGAATG